MSTRDRLAAHFPVFALEVRTPRLTLRFPDDDDVLELADLAVRGVHGEDAMPFTIPWTRIEAPFQQRNTLQYFWTQRGTLQGEAWNLPLVTVVDGRIVGTQGVFTKSWSPARTVETGSWLGLEFQGRGLGKEMRIAALQLAFDGLGAERAVTSAFTDNPSSLGVTRALGYRPNGDERWGRGEDDVVVVQHFTMDRDDFGPLRRSDIEIQGADEVAAIFGTERAPGTIAGS
ncbi:MAG: GNAT family N-acetyltransferase [Acidimicrobiales bacterium]